MPGVSLETKEYTFSDLAARYRHFYAPTFKITVSGSDLVAAGAGIVSLSVSTSVEEADSFSFTVSNAFDIVNREFKWEDRLSLGKTVEIQLGYVDQLKTMLKGPITSINYEFDREGPPKLVIAGMDATFCMMRGVKSREWTNRKQSEVVSAIAGEYSLQTDITDTVAVWRVVAQNRLTDYQFLEYMAAELNYDFFVAGNTLYFKKLPHQDKTPAMTLKWGESLTSFSMEADIGDQVPKVVVRGVDEINKQEIEGSSGSVDKLGDNSRTGPDIIGALCGQGVKEYRYENVSSQSEARERATAILNGRAMKLVTGNVETIGIPEIRAGRYIKLEGLGSKLSQLYYIKSAKHTIGSSGYSTSFTVGGNAF